MPDSSDFRGIPGLVVALACGLVLLCLPFKVAAFPAPLGGKGTGTPPPMINPAVASAGDALGGLGGFDPAVQAVQEALAALKAYQGPQDGVYSPRLRAAIRAYQTANGLSADGRVTPELVAQLNTATRIGALLEGLQKERKSGVEQARRALTENPATRDLLDRPVHETADPTRDPSACFGAPSPDCLLNEASESAKAIHQDDMRDWALGELLVAQSKAGHVQAAMATARRISDPRLIMVALRDMAEALAKGNNSAEAIVAVDIIPDTAHQAEALAAIAAIDIKRGASPAAVKATHAMEVILSGITDRVQRVGLTARASVLYAGAGATAEATRSIEAAGRSAETLDGRERAVALRHIASALAEMGRHSEALSRLDAIAIEAEQVPVLIAAVQAHLATADHEGAMAMAARIPTARFRAYALARIGESQAQVGRATDARNTLELARAALGEGAPAFAKDFVESQVATAFAALADSEGPRASEDALAAAARIKDVQLRAKTLWTIRFRLTGQPNAAVIEKSAEAAASDIKSPLSRAWMFAEIANERADAGDGFGASQAFNSGLDVARDIGNPWARTRALARLASTLLAIGRSEPPVSSP